MYCPEDCNYIDEKTLQFVHREGKSNFTSMAALRCFEQTVVHWMSRDEITAAWKQELAKWDEVQFTAYDVIDFLRYYDPFKQILIEWWHEVHLVYKSLDQ